MTISEKAAYLKGLTDGLGLDAESKEGKLWNVLNDLLGDMAHEIEDLQDSNSDMAEIIDDISEDLSYLEEITCDLDTPDDFSCDGNCGSCGNSCFENEEFDSLDDEAILAFRDEELEGSDLEELSDDIVYDGDEYDIVCPTCGAEFSVTEEDLHDLIECPGCGEELEIDLDEDDDT